MKQIRSTAVVAGALVCCLFGCNSGNVYVPVSGVVTLNDKPYKNASVNFQPIAGDQNTAPAAPRSDTPTRTAASRSSLWTANRGQRLESI